MVKTDLRNEKIKRKNYLITLNGLSIHVYCISIYFLQNFDMTSPCKTILLEIIIS